MVIWAFGVSTFWYILILLEILEIGFFFTHGTLVPTMSVIWTFPARHNIMPGAHVCKVVHVCKEAEDTFSTPHQD